MFSTPLTFAASSMFALSFAAPFRSMIATPNTLTARDTCPTYGGDGSMAAGWPEQNKWIPFDEAWDANLDTIKKSCGRNGGYHEVDDTEAGYMKQAIKDESQASGIPKELILAIVMQESKGCVRIHTTGGGVNINPGLMQGRGTATCNPGSEDGNDHSIYPCPKNTIVAMIHQGTAGQGLPTTLKGELNKFSNDDDDSKFYKAARRYNSGDDGYHKPGEANLAVSNTPCYASDIANRLVQPGIECNCNSETVKSLTETEGTTGSLPLQQNRVSNGQGQKAGPANDNTNIDDENNEDQNNEDQNSATGLSDKAITGAVDNCKKFFVPIEGNSCDKSGVKLKDLLKLNKNLNGYCSNMWAGYNYCIGT